MDKYQIRYLAHQKNKKQVLFDILKKRNSERAFSDKKVDEKLIQKILKSLQNMPSSCDRKAVYVSAIRERDEKNLLGGLLVGGAGWINYAPVIFLLIADGEAYKENLSYMPFLDAGVLIDELYLISNVLGLKSCYCNPNVRVKNQQFFRDRFLGGNSDLIFCGAFAIGYA